MDQIRNFFIGDTAKNYAEVGFSHRQAQAIAWIAEQKSKGKFYGFLSGSFMAYAWGHFHERLFALVNIKCSRIYSQLAIIGLFISAGDYIFCQPRAGANQLIANKLYLNNNLFLANLQSLNNNFEVLNRKFTAEEVKVFNQRAKAMKSNISIHQRKWIFNPLIESQQQFDRRRKLNLSAPWEDEHIRKTIRQQNSDKGTIVYGPQELGKLIDETGTKLGIITDFTFGWRPL